MTEINFLKLLKKVRKLLLYCHLKYCACAKSGGRLATRHTSYIGCPSLRRISAAIHAMYACVKDIIRCTNRNSDNDSDRNTEI